MYMYVKEDVKTSSLMVNAKKRAVGAKLLMATKIYINEKHQKNLIDYKFISEGILVLTIIFTRLKPRIPII